jgi:hypothetical protein
MDEAGILPEADISDSGDETEISPPPAPLSEEGVERLSVFEDFLGKLNLDNLDDKNKPSDDDKPSDKPDKPKKPKKP